MYNIYTPYKVIYLNIINIHSGTDTEVTIYNEYVFNYIF